MSPQPLVIAGTALPLIAALAALAIPDYWVTLLTYAGMSAVLCIGLVMMTGYGGITSFGQAAFAGIAAYATAILTTGLALSPWLGLLTGLALAVASAFVIGWITVRLSGHYLVLGTFAWGISLFYAFANVEGLGGYNGIGGVPGLFGGSRLLFNALVWAFVAVALLGAVRVLDSRIGRAIRAAPSKAMAESFGVDTATAKLTVFVLAAALAGAAGWLQAHYLRIVNPGPFHLNASVEYLFMTIIGGVGSLLGAIVGATAVTVAKSWLQTSVPALLGSGFNLEGVVFGLLVLGLLQAAPRGMTALLPASFALRPRGSRRSETRLPPRAKPAATRSVLALRSVSKHFSGAQALDRVSLDLNAGEILALVGPNGAGKSTLFNAITGLSPASNGTVALLGEDVTRLPARAIARRGLARTFQHAHLRPEMTVIENVSLGAHTRTAQGVAAALLGRDRPEESRIFGEARGCLAELGVAEFANARTGTLSLGSQRLVEVARAVACDPIALLLDEPAAGLRAEEKQHLANAIVAMRDRGIAILVVEHDLDFVANVADRVVVLDFGTVIAQGTPDEIVRDPRVIAAYLGQAEVSGDVARALHH